MVSISLLQDTMVSVAFCLFSLEGGSPSLPPTLDTLRRGFMVVCAPALSKDGWRSLLIFQCKGKETGQQSSSRLYFPAVPCCHTLLHPVGKTEPGLEDIAAWSLPVSSPQGSRPLWHLSMMCTVLLQLAKTTHRCWQSENVSPSSSIVRWIMTLEVIHPQLPP